MSNKAITFLEGMLVGILLATVVYFSSTSLSKSKSVQILKTNGDVSIVEHELLYTKRYNELTKRELQALITLSGNYSIWFETQPDMETSK
jgi:cell division protein FtsL